DLSVGYMVKVVTAQSTAEHDANSVARSGQAHHLPVCPCRWISGARRLSVRPNWTLAICAYPAAKCIDSPIAREGRPVTSTNPRQVAAGTLLRPALGAIKRRVADAAHRGVVLAVHRERRALLRSQFALAGGVLVGQVLRLPAAPNAAVGARISP